jgi:hypothetical protein
MPEACLPIGRSLIGHPELVDNSGFRSIDRGNVGSMLEFMDRY